jgi:hypothetical protein
VRSKVEGGLPVVERCRAGRWARRGLAVGAGQGYRPRGARPDQRVLIDTRTETCNTRHQRHQRSCGEAQRLWTTIEAPRLCATFRGHQRRPRGCCDLPERMSSPGRSDTPLAVKREACRPGTHGQHHWISVTPRRFSMSRSGVHQEARVSCQQAPDIRLHPECTPLC